MGKLAVASLFPDTGLVTDVECSPEDIGDPLVAEEPKVVNSGGLTTLLTEYVEAIHDCDVKKSSFEAADERVERLKFHVITALEQVGLTSARLPSGELFSLVEKHKYSLPPKSDPEARRQALVWLAKIGAKELIAPDINHQTLNSFLRERAEAGKKIDPKHIKDFCERSLSVTSLRRKTKS